MKNTPLPPIPKLTVRNRQVLELVIAGMTNKDIANKLCITLRAVEKQKSRIYEITGTRSAVSLLIYYQHNNIIEKKC